MSNSRDIPVEKLSDREVCARDARRIKRGEKPDALDVEEALMWACSMAEIELRTAEQRRRDFLAKQDALRRGGAVIVCLIALMWFCFGTATPEAGAILALVALCGLALKAQAEASSRAAGNLPMLSKRIRAPFRKSGSGG